jgi:hypothetical protein
MMELELLHNLTTISRPGSPFAAELDRKLVGKEPLPNIVAWWCPQYWAWHDANNIDGIGDLSYILPCRLNRLRSLHSSF